VGISPRQEYVDPYGQSHPYTNGELEWNGGLSHLNQYQSWWLRINGVGVRFQMQRYSPEVIEYGMGWEKTVAGANDYERCRRKEIEKKTHKEEPEEDSAW